MPDETNAAADAVQGEPPPGPVLSSAVPSSAVPAAPRPSHRRRQRIALIAGAVVAAMAAAVAAIAITASPTSHYTNPDNACTLVRPATLAKYLPGRGRGKSGSGNCQWSAGKRGVLFVFAAALDDVTKARNGFPEMIRDNDKGATRNGTTTTITGKQAVTGVGDQATALFQTSVGSATAHKRVGAVVLIVRSGNAVVQVIRASGVSSPVSGPALLPGAIVIAREILAAMPALGPGSPGVGVHISLDVSYPVGGVILGDTSRGDQHQGIAE